ncbi:ATP-dependent DEAD/H RNA helicase [Trypanosoma rangeli]|uniref:ATP-dependent DEAD/H RNA helicase n=1 Tax=Trypanosoma rangeli TaxID=5698 RepID=A0A3R7LSK7_TRYRA|nr:ATP-dependent DEAD/H RNA helicase [Trypanosoma rangeli]RNF02529.1 ATP-dependent DEAD/H RNA helicase [Trypanosoma rangeli]|eukprot:RNF02529.1 ATP-dependent DEAD/H RNA helicase [Trypanosoma rangeli]
MGRGGGGYRSGGSGYRGGGGYRSGGGGGKYRGGGYQGGYGARPYPPYGAAVPVPMPSAPMMHAGGYPMAPQAPVAVGGGGMYSVPHSQPPPPHVPMQMPVAVPQWGQAPPPLAGEKRGRDSPERRRSDSRERYRRRSRSDSRQHRRGSDDNQHRRYGSHEHR